MSNKDPQRPNRSSREAFDEKRLAKDVASVLSQFFVEGEEFIGHDGRQYVIICVSEQEAESESFIDVMVKLDGRHELAAKYAILLQQISR